MARLLLVRHGRAAAGWGDELDPGLDAVGRAQAAAVASDLDAALGPCALVTSPSARARETIAPLEQRWVRRASIDPAFGEVPSPTDHLEERAAWLAEALGARWGDLDERVDAWRRRLVDAALAVEADTVVASHFVAINALVAVATGDPAVTVFLPANASVTEFDVQARTPQRGAKLTLVRVGSEAAPVVG